MKDPKEVLTIVEYEGYEIEEARLVYAQRKELPDDVFCGPDKTYPSNDAKSVRDSFEKLSEFGRGLPKSVALTIYQNLLKHAKRYEIEHDQSKFNWLIDGKKIKEINMEKEKMLKWLDEEINTDLKNMPIEEAFWIAKAIGKKGALRKALGVKEDETIPESILEKIRDTETGNTVIFKGKKITVTTQLKRRAILALRLSKMPKRGRK